MTTKDQAGGKEKISPISGMVRRDGAALFVNANPRYRWDVGEQSMELQIAMVNMLHSGQSVLIIGPTGTGKTLSVKQFAYDLSQGSGMNVWHNGKNTVIDPASVMGFGGRGGYMRPVPLVMCQGTPDTTYSELCGWWQPIDGGVRFIEGLLPEAIRLANERGAAVLLVDEINAIRPEYQKALNSLLTDRKVIFADRWWELKEGAKLMIVATMNDLATGYGGINAMNEDLKRRFSLKVRMSYPQEDEEKKILMDYTQDADMIKKLILLARHTRGSEGGAAADSVAPFTSPISTADLTNFLTTYRSGIELYHEHKFALENSLRMSILNKYYSQIEEDERKAIREKIADIFGVALRG